jgi:hypothetical protein
MQRLDIEVDGPKPALATRLKGCNVSFYEPNGYYKTQDSVGVWGKHDSRN